MQSENNYKTDAEIIELYQAGELKSLDTLVNRHKNKLYSTILMEVNDNALAQDLLQDAFVKIIKALKSGGYSYKEFGQFATWAIRLTKNLCMDHLKKTTGSINNKGFKRGYYSTDLPLEDYYHVPAPEPFIKSDDLKEKMLLLDIIDKLRPEQREVVVLRHYEGMSFKDIARLQQCSINTITARMKYALTSIRRMYIQETLDIAV